MSLVVMALMSNIGSQFLSVSVVNVLNQMDSKLIGSDCQVCSLWAFAGIHSFSR